MSDLAERIGAYLTARMPDVGQITVKSVGQIYGGASRETYRVRISSEKEGDRGLIFRRDPVSTLIETERAVEFAAFQSFADTDVPVPRALFLEDDPRWLERPFFVMEEVMGAKSASAMGPDPYGANRAQIGEQFFGTLGRIATRDVASSALDAFLAPVAPTEAWQRELSHWERVIDEDELEPQPIARAAIRWMRRNPPPAAQRISIVHGDYRSGNFLTDGERILAILDWEMTHLGDPLEDFAWAMDPLWCHGNPEVVGGMLPRADAIAAWEAASGLRVDPRALDWWAMFASLKGLAIWISSAKEYESGTNTEAVIGFSAMYCQPYHNRVLAERLASMADGR